MALWFWDRFALTIRNCTNTQKLLFLITVNTDYLSNTFGPKITEHSTASASRILHPQPKGRCLWKRAQRLLNAAQSHSANHRTRTCTPLKWNCRGSSEGKNIVTPSETFTRISCGIYSKFHLKGRAGWHVFPYSKLHLATELTSWLKYFCITGTTSGGVCCPFPALALASRVIKQICHLGSSSCRIRFSPDHANLLDFAVKQRRNIPLFP